MRVIYKTDLHVNPCPAPNYSNPCHFHNDALQIFHPDHGSSALVDRALTQIGDPGLSAEVMQYRWCVEEHDDVAALYREILWCKLTTDQELLTTSHFLANTRGASRIRTTTFTEPTPAIITAQRISSSPEPLPAPVPSMNHIPPIVASQGPPDWTPSSLALAQDGQFTYALLLPDNSGHHDKIPFCRLCLVQGHNKNTCTQKGCYFCNDNHSSFICLQPYICCQDNRCYIPLSHANHRLTCPAPMNNLIKVNAPHPCTYCANMAGEWTNLTQETYMGVSS